MPTLDVQLLDDSSIVQIHPGAVRVIRPDRRANEWQAPKRRTIQRTACNARQVAIAVSGGEIYYFELDLQSQQLLVRLSPPPAPSMSTPTSPHLPTQHMLLPTSYAGLSRPSALPPLLCAPHPSLCIPLPPVSLTPRPRRPPRVRSSPRLPRLDRVPSERPLQNIEEAKKGMGSDVACLALPPVPEGRQRAKFLAVGTYDSKVAIMSLDPDSLMEKIAVMGTHKPAEALLFLAPPAATAPFQLHVGTSDGVLVRASVDRTTGQLSDQRQRFLGTRQPKLVVRGAWR